MTAVPPPPADGPREALGRQVRDVWVQWASEQPDPKPTWLVGWDELDEGQREVDMRIGETLAQAAVAVPEETRDDDKLAEAEHRIRHNASMPNPKYADERILLAEYDRRAQEIANLRDAFSAGMVTELRAENERDLFRRDLEAAQAASRQITEWRKAEMDERDRLSEQVAAVREIHKRAVYGEGTEYKRVVCDWCRDASEEAWPWPCPTIAALEGTS